MKYKVLLIDDDAVVLADQAEKWAKEHRVLVVGQFTGIADAMRFLGKRKKVDIIVCDIDMPGIDGIEGADLLQPKCNFMVFLTGYTDYALPAYKKHVDMYFMKPLTDRNVLDVLTKFENRMGYSALADGFSESFMVSGLGSEQLINVDVAKITKICTNGHYVNVYAPDLVGVAHMSMKQVVTFLAPTDLFTRVNQSTVVSFHFMDRYEKGYLYMKDKETRYRLGDVYGPAARQFIKRHKLKGSGSA